MSAPDVFDEQLSLRRLHVALKRTDWRMFEQGLDRLQEEIDRRSPFRDHTAWQTFFKLASEHEALEEALKTRLHEALTSLLSIEVAIQAPTQVPAEADEQAPAGVAIVAGWHSRLQDPALATSLDAWFTASPAAKAPRVEDLRSPQRLLNQANVALAACAAGLEGGAPGWLDRFMAWLHQVLRAPVAPPLGDLLALLPESGPFSILTVEPGLGWEQAYPGLRRGPDGPAGPMSLVKLAGSIDWYFCHGCHALAVEDRPSTLRALAVACPGCGGPAWPLVLPADKSPFMPEPLRDVWIWGAERLRAASTWVLIDPPMPDDSGLVRLLVANMQASKRVLVIGDEPVLKAWQGFWSEQSVSTVVTSRGPADQVLGFLLQGGVPELESVRESAAAGAGKKKHRR